MTYPRRDVVDAIGCLVRTGCRWDALPVDFPPAALVKHYFTAWTRDGTLSRAHNTLREQVRQVEGRSAEPTAALVDSQTVRGSDTVPRTSRGYDAGKRANGRKRHIVTDTCGWLLAVLVTGAHVPDRDAGHTPHPPRMQLHGRPVVLPLAQHPHHITGPADPRATQLEDGMGISFKGIWGYHPLVVSLANTREVLYLVNRSGNAPSHQDAATWIDKAIDLVAPHAPRVCVRGDTDFSLTANFDRWAQRVDFVLGMDAHMIQGRSRRRRCLVVTRGPNRRGA